MEIEIPERNNRICTQCKNRFTRNELNFWCEWHCIKCATRVMKLLNETLTEIEEDEKTL